MPVSFKVVDNRTNVSKKIEQLNNQLENYGKYFLEGMATEIVLNSPVDTGTYMDAHSLGNTRAKGLVTSTGKPKGQSHNEYAQAARDRLVASIESLGENWTNAIFSNNAAHAYLVEYAFGSDDGRGTYGAPYTIARNKAPIIAQEAAQRAKGS